MERSQVTQYPFEVVKNELAAEGIWRLRIECEVAGVLRPGQFMNLAVPGDGSHVLRIPLSFARSDAQEGWVELLYALVGEGTRRLAAMGAGEGSTLLGPCGRPWRLPEAGGRAVLVAGGIGLPPILAAARMLADAGIGFDLVAGARTQAAHVLPDATEALHFGGVRLPEHGWEGGYDLDRAVVLTTDDGSVEGDGVGRFATDALVELMRRNDYVQAYACGPEVMLAKVAQLTSERGIACQVSLERMMGCGFGACSCCNVALAGGGYALCCQEGPVFDASEVAW